MYCSSLVPSFTEIGPSVTKKVILKRFTIYGHGSHLDHRTLIIYMYVETG